MFDQDFRSDVGDLHGIPLRFDLGARRAGFGSLRTRCDAAAFRQEHGADRFLATSKDPLLLLEHLLAFACDPRHRYQRNGRNRGDQQQRSRGELNVSPAREFHHRCSVVAGVGHVAAR